MKQVEMAFQAFVRSGIGPGARLELYGVHKDMDRYRTMARELGIASQVRFEGFVANGELPARLAGADVLLNPTAADDLPQVWLETSALGIPAIASRVGGVPEIVIDDTRQGFCALRMMSMRSLTRVEKPPYPDSVGPGAKFWS